jgi:sugar phosphate isomerase/epimerase
MKRLSHFLFLILVFHAGLESCKPKAGSGETATTSETAPTAADLGWELGAQTYSFREFTLEETFDRMAQLGLEKAEIYAGQTIGGGSDEKVHFTMAPELRQKVLGLAADKGISIVQFGVIAGENEDEWRQIFEFARAMGISTVTSEPRVAHLDLVNRLAEEQGVRVAIHNHPAPSSYWHPDSVVAAIQGRPMLGACADVGHWKRSGLDPIESLRKLEGRITTFHIKDIASADPAAEDVAWGTGVCDIAGVMAEMHRQGFRGLWSIEHEADSENPNPPIGQSLQFFHETVSAL